ncbi:3',5'-cyclic-nucleotide phosphodiesterase pde1 [Tulasnella sp. 403]|nr:3',5'-cyclic-nucleotide phosphodiesterase pde1 [Tulasnella sp. 403]
MNFPFPGVKSGSGLGALSQLVRNDPFLFQDDEDEDDGDGGSSKDVFPPEVASRIYSCIQSFIITHGHLDHVMSLVISAGSQGGSTKYILGLPQTIQILETIFNGLIWPRLAARQGELAPEFFYRYKPVSPHDQYVRVANGISACVMPVSHGSSEQSLDGTYESSAWFVRNDLSGREFLFFGDVEPDSLSLNPRTRAVWRMAAPKIRDKTLNTIFLECSWRSQRAASELYGHLSPPYVLDELRSLATEVVTVDTRKPPKSSYLGFLWNMLGLRALSDDEEEILPDDQLYGALSGLRLVVIHCKASTEAYPDGLEIADVIAREISDLVSSAGLGITVVAARQGMTLEI